MESAVGVEQVVGVGESSNVGQASCSRGIEAAALDATGKIRCDPRFA